MIRCIIISIYYDCNNIIFELLQLYISIVVLAADDVYCILIALRILSPEVHPGRPVFHWAALSYAGLYYPTVISERI